VSLAENDVTESQALMREAIRNTNSEVKALGAEDRQNRENRAAFAILAMFSTIINRTHFPML